MILCPFQKNMRFQHSTTGWNGILRGARCFHLWPTQKQRPPKMRTWKMFTVAFSQRCNDVKSGEENESRQKGRGVQAFMLPGLRVHGKNGGT